MEILKLLFLFAIYIAVWGMIHQLKISRNSSHANKFQSVVPYIIVFFIITLGILVYKIFNVFYDVKILTPIVMGIVCQSLIILFRKICLDFGELDEGPQILLGIFILSLGITCLFFLVGFICQITNGVFDSSEIKIIFINLFIAGITTFISFILYNRYIIKYEFEGDKERMEYDIRYEMCLCKKITNVLVLIFIAPSITFFMIKLFT